MVPQQRRAAWGFRLKPRDHSDDATADECGIFPRGSCGHSARLWRTGVRVHSAADGLHFVAHLVGVLVAPVGLLLHGADDDLIHALVHGDALRWQIKHTLRHLPAEHFVKHHAEAVDVGAVIHVHPAFLLGRHVVGRAENGAGHRVAGELLGAR